MCFERAGGAGACQWDTLSDEAKERFYSFYFFFLVCEVGSGGQKPVRTLIRVLFLLFESIINLIQSNNPKTKNFWEQPGKYLNLYSAPFRYL